MSDSAVTHAGIDINIGDKTYAFSPLRFEDLEWLELRLRARAIQAGRLSIPDDASESEREAMMAQVLEHAQRIELFSSIESLLTPVGVTWLLYRMLRRAHPNISMDTVGEWVRDRELMREVRPQLMVLMGITPAKKNLEAT